MGCYKVRVLSIQSASKCGYIYILHIQLFHKVVNSELCVSCGSESPKVKRFSARNKKMAYNDPGIIFFDNKVDVWMPGIPPLHLPTLFFNVQFMINGYAHCLESSQTIIFINCTRQFQELSKHHSYQLNRNHTRKSDMIFYTNTVLWGINLHNTSMTLLPTGGEKLHHASSVLRPYLRVV